MIFEQPIEHLPQTSEEMDAWGWTPSSGSPAIDFVVGTLADLISGFVMLF